MALLLGLPPKTQNRVAKSAAPANLPPAKGSHAHGLPSERQIRWQTWLYSSVCHPKRKIGWQNQQHPPICHPPKAAMPMACHLKGKSGGKLGSTSQFATQNVKSGGKFSSTRQFATHQWHCLSVLLNRSAQSKRSTDIMVLLTEIGIFSNWYFLQLVFLAIGIPFLI